MIDARKGLVGGAVLYAVMLVGIHYGSPIQTDAMSGGAYVLSSALAGLITNSSVRVLVSVILHLGSSVLVALLCRAWTANTLVALAAGALFAAHPAAAELTRSSLGIVFELPTFLVLLAFQFRQHALLEAHHGRSPLRFEAIAFGIYLLALASGPAALSAAVLMPVITGIFQRESGAFTLKRRIPLMGLYGIAAIVALFLMPPSSLPKIAWSRFWPFTSLFAAPPRWDSFEGTFLAVASVLLSGAGVVYAVATVRRHPRWVVIHGSFALFVFVAAQGPELLELASPGPFGFTLALLGPALLGPSLLWRLLLAVWPEPSLDSRHPPLPPDPSAFAVSPMRPMSKAAPSAATPNPTDLAAVTAAARVTVERVVETAVAAAISAAVQAAQEGAKFGAQSATRWDRVEAGLQRRVRGVATELLSLESNDRADEAALFRASIEPWLHPDAVALYLAPAHGHVASLMASGVRRLIVVDSVRARLRQTAEDLVAIDRVDFLLLDGDGLSALATASVEFAYSERFFLPLDQEDMYRYLGELRRVLRPGGRALVAFANLADPLGFESFKIEVERHRTRHRGAGRINFVTPDLIRILVDHAGLTVAELKLSANGRDLYAALERGL